MCNPVEIAQSLNTAPANVHHFSGFVPEKVIMHYHLLINQLYRTILVVKNTYLASFNNYLNMIFYCLLLAFILILFYTLIIPYIKFKIWVRSLPPGGVILPFKPFFGTYYTSFFKNSRMDYQKYLYSKANEFPDTKFIASNFWTKNLICLVDPKYIKAFHNQQNQSFVKFQLLNDMFKVCIGDGLIFKQLQQHRVRRKMFVQMFTFDFLQSNSPKIKSIIESHVKSWKNKNIQIHKEAAKITSHIILAIFIGLDTQTPKVDGRNIIQFLGQFMDLIIRERFKLSYLIFGLISRKVRRMRDIFHHDLTEFLKENLHLISKQKSLLKLIMQNYSGEQKLDVAVNQLKSFLFAGTETTSLLMSFCVYNLIKHPPFQKRVYQEIQDYDISQINFNTGKQLKFTNALITETQRLFGPINFVLSRRASQDTFLLDLFIQKDTVIQVNSDTNCFSQKYFKKANSFDPDRWLSNVKPQEFVLLPFSAGSRNCIGQHLALFQTRTFLAMLVSEFELKSNDIENNPVVLKDIFYFKNPFRVQLKPRFN